MFSYQAAQSKVSRWEALVDGGAVNFNQLKSLLGEINDFSEDEYIESATDEIRDFISQRMLKLVLEDPGPSFEDLRYVLGKSDYVSEEENSHLLEKMLKCAKDFSHFVFLFHQFDDDTQKRSFLVKMKEVAGSEKERRYVALLACCHRFHDVMM